MNQSHTFANIEYWFYQKTQKKHRVLFIYLLGDVNTTAAKCKLNREIDKKSSANLVKLILDQYDHPQSKSCDIIRVS